MSRPTKNSLQPTCPPRKIRMLNNNQCCLLCKNKVMKEEAHWCCPRCRRNKPVALCDENCTACTAMVEDEWRRKALMAADKKRSFISAFRNMTDQSIDGVCKSKEQPRKKKIIKSKGGNKRNKSTAAKCGMGTSQRNVSILKTDILHKPQESSNKKETLAQSPSVSSQEISNVSSKIKKTYINSGTFRYLTRLRDFELLLLHDLDPKLPTHLVQVGFVMPVVPENLKCTFSVTKNELVRLMSSASIAFHLSNIKTLSDPAIKGLLNANADGLSELYSGLIKNKANSLANIIIDIRDHILSQVTCKDKSVIPLMINGQIDPKASFFGNINVLEMLVKKDKANVLCLRKK